MKKSISVAAAIAIAGGLALAPAPAASASASSLASVPARTADSAPAPQAAAKASIIVQLVSPTKKPLALDGAYVSIATPDFEFVQGRSTNDSGRARFSVPAGVALDIDANKAGYVTGTRHIGDATAGATTVLRVVLPKGASIAGTVRTAAGVVLKGSTVTVFKTNGQWVDSAVSSTKGAYRISGLASGRYRVQFNSRVDDPPRPVVITNYAWNYWKAASWGTANAVVLTQQTSSAAATARKAVNGAVPRGSSIRGEVSIPGLAGGADVGLEPPNFVDRAIGRLNSAGTAFSLKAVKGKYRVYVWGDDETDDMWWYTGDTTPPSRDEDDAKLVSFSGTADLTLRFRP